MFLYVIRTVSVTPTLFAIRVSASPHDGLAVLRRNAPFGLDLVAQQAIDQRHAVTIRGMVRHVLKRLGLHQENDWFTGDAGLAAFLDQGRFDEWCSSTPAIAALTSGFVVPQTQRNAPEATGRCAVRTTRDTRCQRRTLTSCVTCNRLCCGPHSIRAGDTYCRRCWPELQRQWDLEEREKGKAEAEAKWWREVTESGPDYLGLDETGPEWFRR